MTRRAWNTSGAPGTPLRIGSHAHCPQCEEVREFKHYNGKQQRQAWTCVTCGHYLYPTAGTIFHKSSTALHLWFYAMYIMASTRCGVSAKQLERELGVTYKTAWRMFTLIRNQLMVQDDVILTGSVEADETYVGGARRGGPVKNHRGSRARPGSRTRRPARGTKRFPCSAWSNARAAFVPTRWRMFRLPTLWAESASMFSRTRSCIPTRFLAIAP